MTVPTKAAQDALKWIKERGGSAAIVNTRAGGWQFLAQGEVGPFIPATIAQLLNLGLAEKRDGRIWVKS